MTKQNLRSEITNGECDELYKRGRHVRAIRAKMCVKRQMHVSIDYINIALLFLHKIKQRK